MPDKVKSQLSPREQVLYQHMRDNSLNNLSAGSSLGLQAKRLWHFRRHLSSKKLGNIISTLFFGGFTTPYMWLDSLRNGPVRSHQITKDPIFILGAYRSGTTHLHNLMAQNKELTYPDSVTTTLARSYRSLSWLIRPLGAKAKPRVRPIDHIPLDMDSPQEQQFAMLGLMSPLSTEFLMFPRAYPELKQLGFIAECPEAYQKEWKTKLMGYLKKLSYTSGGKQLVLKNPHDTANIPTLLELFPNAKFIFIHRDPWKIYASMVNTFRAVAYHIQWENNDYFQLTELFGEIAMDVYKDLLRRYLDHRDLIPKGNLVEVGYSDLVADRVGHILDIHERLGIESPASLREDLERYLEEKSQSNYKRNEFDPLTEEKKNEIRQAWGFVFDAFGYSK